MTFFFFFALKAIWTVIYGRICRNIASQTEEWIEEQNVVLQKDAESTIDGKKEESLREIEWKNKNYFSHNQIETVELI